MPGLGYSFQLLKHRKMIPVRLKYMRQNRRATRMRLTQRLNSRMWLFQWQSKSIQRRQKP